MNRVLKMKQHAKRKTHEEQGHKVQTQGVGNPLLQSFQPKSFDPCSCNLQGGVLSIYIVFPQIAKLWGSYFK